MQSEIELALNRATILITDSEFVRQEVVNTFSWPLERVRVVPLASAAEFHPREPSEIANLLGQYGLVPGNYCLAVGTIEPRKNVDRLLDAYALLPSAIQRQWPLILAGYHGWSNTALHARIAAAQHSGWLRYLNFVPAGHLPALYAGARLFIFPSVYEGFGLPVLEAMASGTPVVCSNSSSLPEVAGGAAAMCDAFDVEALSRLIAAGLQDEQWRSVARSKGLMQATRFSWQRCARETFAVYQAAVCA
jgi:alpha-1,3-rhamnosyl/mannosyltransferase